MRHGKSGKKLAFATVWGNFDTFDVNTYKTSSADRLVLFTLVLLIAHNVGLCPSVHVYIDTHRHTQTLLCLHSWINVNKGEAYLELSCCVSITFTLHFSRIAFIIFPLITWEERIQSSGKVLAYLLVSVCVNTVTAPAVHQQSKWTAGIIQNWSIVLWYWSSIHGF